MKTKSFKNGVMFNGDCLEVMKIIPDKSVDMVLCDLPYGTTACKWDNVIPFEPLWEQYGRIIKDNGAIVLFGSEPFSSKLRMSNLKMYKYDWVWDKVSVVGFANAKKMPLYNVENILVFYRKLPTYNPQGVVKINKKVKNGKTHSIKNIDKGITAINGGRLTGNYTQEYTNYPKQILTFGRDKEKLHPTQKPVALLEYLIKTYTNENEVILDNCMGSGSTCVACQNTGRKFIGIELEEKYFDIALNRIEENDNDK